MKGEKHIGPIDFSEYLTPDILNQTLQRTAKFIMADFYEIDFMKRIFMLVDEITRSLKVC